MAQQKFSIVSIDASLQKGAIIVNCSLVVDEDSVTPDSIFVLNHKNRSLLNVETVVDGHDIYIKSKDYEPNTTYAVYIQASVSDIVGTHLEDALMRNLTFNSDVTSTVAFTTPSNFELTSLFHFVWKETPAKPTDQLVNSYELQVSRENAFYNITNGNTISINGKNEYTMEPPADEGQYYARIRAVKGTEVGIWSDIVTFTYKKSATAPNTDTGSGTQSPITIEDRVETGELTVNYDVLCETIPDDFPFSFSEAISSDGIEISVTRSDV